MKKNIFIPLLLISSFVFAQNTDEILIKDNQVWKDEYNRLKMIYVTKNKNYAQYSKNGFQLYFITMF